jgi:hypothetical protein
MAKGMRYDHDRTSITSRRRKRRLAFYALVGLFSLLLIAFTGFMIPFAR